MTAAIAPNRNDCTAKIRMLETIQRCPTAAICSTRTSAAIRVMIRFPNSAFGTNCILSASEQERGNQRQRSQNKSDHQQFRYSKQTQLRIGSLHQNHKTTEQEQLGEVDD